jgi:hypothetical protein
MGTGVITHGMMKQIPNPKHGATHLVTTIAKRALGIDHLPG